MGKQVNKNKNKNILTKERKHETMKTMRKLLAMALVLMLALTLVPTALADEPNNGKIQVTGSGSTIYNIYKMFELEPASGKYKYRVTDEWANFRAEEYFTVENNYVIWKKATVSAIDGAAIAQLAKEFASQNSSINPLDATVKIGETVEVPGNGYYLLVPNDDTACGVVAVIADETKTVTAKTEEPEFPRVEKKVQEDSTQTYGDSNDADIGQTIHFHSTITVGTDAVNYVLHDKMDEHFDFHADSVSITRGGNPVATTDYKVVVGDKTNDDCTFHIEFENSFTKTLAKGATLVVSYTAALNGNADVDIDHKNETWLTHTNGISTPHDYTTTQTYQVTVIKQDQNQALLPGATFVLKDNIGKFYKVDEKGNVTWVDTVDQATQLETTVENNCTVTFKGVDAEVFTLVEHVVPGGYIGQTDIPVNTKIAETSDNGKVVHSKIVTVTNTLGNALPETGGMGTTLFYLVGGLMVVAAVVLLVTKKRMRAAE